MSDVPGRDLKYNQLEYRQYSERLRAICCRNKYAQKVLCGVFKDPVTSFITYNQTAAALFADDEKPSEQEVKVDPTTALTKFVEAMLAKNNNDGENFTEKVKERLEDSILQWGVDHLFYRRGVASRSPKAYLLK